MHTEIKNWHLAEAFAIAGILIIAAILRLWNIGSTPQALHYDEALNGLMALDILAGETPPMLEQPGDREPLIFYLQAISIEIFGRTPGALRLPTTLASIGLVLGALLVARELFGRRVGLLTGLLSTITFWPIYLGRLGTRPVLFPFLLSLAVFAALRAWRQNNRRWWITAGLIFGSTHYTYTPNVFTLPAIGLTLLALILVDRSALRIRSSGAITMILVAAIISAPILIHRTTLEDQDSARTTEVAVFYPGQNIQDFTRTVLSQTVLLARMFFIKGDLNIRHNIPGRPILDLLMAIPFIFGFYMALQIKNRQRALLGLLWLCIFLLPSFLSKNAPHFFRASGSLPFLFFWSAIGLIGLYKALGKRLGAYFSLLISSGILCASMLITLDVYIFDEYLQQPDVLEAFNADDTAHALEINRRYEVGWIGDNLRALPHGEQPLPDLEVLGIGDGDVYAQFLVPVRP